MDPHRAALGTPDPDAVEFVRFCYHRRRVGWPELYDEMCAVAARGLYRGLDADDLSAFGIGFSLFDMPALAVIARQVSTEELARRRPVAVVIRAEPEPDAVVESAVGSTQDARPEAEPESMAAPRPYDVPARLKVAPTPV
jgi:hypothetical protein